MWVRTQVATCKLLLELGPKQKEARGVKRDLKIDMVNEYISAIPFSIPDPERSCLFHFTTSIENGSSFFPHCKKSGGVKKRIR